MALFSPLYRNNPKSESYRLRIWRAFAFLIFTVLIHTSIRLFFAEATEIPAMLCLLLGASLFFVLMLYLSFGKDALERLQSLLKSQAGIIFFVLMVIGILLGSREERNLLFIHANLTYLPMMVILYSQLFHDSEKPKHWREWLGFLLILLVIVSVIRVLGLSYHPSYHSIDEPWTFSFLIHHQQTGELGDPLYYGRTVDLPYVLLPMSYWLQNFEPTLWAGRLYEFFLYFFFIALMGITAYHLYDKRIAFFTILTAFGSATLYGSVHLRHDLSFMIFIAASFAAYAYALKRQSGFWHGMAGAFIGLSLYAHYHAIGLGPMLTIGFYLPLYLAKRRGEYDIPYRHVVFFILGGLLGAIIVFLTNILPYWSATLEGREWRGVDHPLLFVILFIRYIYLSRQFLFEQILSLVALALLFNKRSPKDSVLIWLFFLGPLTLSIIARGGYAHYMQHVAPVYALMIGRALTKFLDWIPIKAANISLMTGTLILSLLIGNTTPLFVLEEQRPLILEDPQIVQWIKENIAPNSVIVGPDWYYFFLYKDYQFYSMRSWEEMSNMRRETYENNPDNLWEEINPAAIIFVESERINMNNEEILIEESYALNRPYELHSLVEETIYEEDAVPVKVYFYPESLILRPIGE